MTRLTPYQGWSNRRQAPSASRDLAIPARPRGRLRRIAKRTALQALPSGRWLREHGPCGTFARAERAAQRLGVWRSEFVARAAEQWLDILEEQSTTDAINQAIGGTDPDSAFPSAAAAALPTSVESW